MDRTRGSGAAAAHPATGGTGRTLTGLCLALLSPAMLGLTGGCGRDASSRGTAPPAAQELAGVWDAAFTLDPPPVGFDSTALRRAPGGQVRGTLALLPNRWLAGAAGLPARPAVYGTYDVDFGPFGFDPREDGRVPDAVATAAPAAGDSVVLVLEPAAARVRVWLAGTWRADSAFGRWRTEQVSRAGVETAGRFVLRLRPPAAHRVAPRAGAG